MFYLDQAESEGRLLFEEVVKMDLEGIVCKRKDSPYKVTLRSPPRTGSRLRIRVIARGKGERSCSRADWMAANARNLVLQLLSNIPISFPDVFRFVLLKLPAGSLLLLGLPDPADCVFKIEAGASARNTLRRINKPGQIHPRPHS
jgi:hypothetical protein